MAFFPVNGPPTLVLPVLEATKPASGPVAIDWQWFPWSDEQGPKAAFAAASRALALSGRTLAVEELVMRVRELRSIESSAPGVRYASDITRTFAVGAVDDELRRVYDDV